MSTKSIAIIMGSKTDLQVMKQATDVLKDFKINCHVEIVSAHRTPEKMVHFAKDAQKNGFKVIIAGAGGAAHLPGMVASLTSLPVIGVPIALGKLNGLDALLSIVQMPKGIPVATVAIENAQNAALLAVRILALSDSGLLKKLEEFQSKQIKKVAQMNKELRHQLRSTSPRRR
jgi:5-(carboxyamino)imidazole ribonucleotide mutase